VLPASWSDGLSVLAMAAGRRVDGPAGAVADVLDEALERVERLRRDRQLLPVLDPADALERGRAVAGLARSTDVQRLQAGAPGRFSFVVPDAGALLVTDHLVVPRGAARAADAARLVAHYLEPAVAAAVSGTVPGLCPVAGASDVLAETDAVRAVSPLLFPTDADLARTQVLTPLDPDVAAGYAEAYATLTHP
jgi:spermidine/putrescine transport system substrate-binding protein